MSLRILISLISVFVTLLFCELLIRIFYPAPSVIRFLLGEKDSAYELSENPILGYHLKANFKSENPDCHHTFDYTNSFGQRDVERALAKDRAKKRILMLGDSVVAGHGICDLENTISMELERLLESENTEVLNFGVGGYCTLAEVELLREKGLQFSPDEVLLIFVNNDYVNSNGTIITQIKSDRPRAVDWIFRQSHIARWSGLRFDLFGYAKDFDPLARSALNKEAIGDNNVEEGLLMLKQLAEENNFKPRVFLWPYFTDTHILEPKAAEESPLQDKLWVENLAQELGIEIHRLSGFFKTDLEMRISDNLQKTGKKRRRPPSPRWVYTIGDGIHPSKLGSSVGAEAIANFIKKCHDC